MSNAVENAAVTEQVQKKGIFNTFFLKMAQRFSASFSRIFRRFVNSKFLLKKQKSYLFHSEHGSEHDTYDPFLNY